MNTYKPATVARFSMSLVVVGEAEVESARAAMSAGRESFMVVVMRVRGVGWRDGGERDAR